MSADIVRNQLLEQILRQLTRIADEDAKRNRLLEADMAERLEAMQRHDAREQAALDSFLEAAAHPFPGVRPAVPGTCDRAPYGWYCTRERGHDGPCAALPAEPPDTRPTFEEFTKGDPDDVALVCRSCGPCYRDGCEHHQPEKRS